MDFEKALKFLSRLKRNNHKTWFDKNKEEYLEIKESFENWLGELIKNVEKIDGSIRNLEAKHCVFRIYKDVRFSKDKTPYKTHLGAYIAKGGRKSPSAGYYFHLEPGNSFLAGGIWMPESENLSKIRQEIDYNTDEFLKILKDKTFKKYFGEITGEKLSRNPKDYPADHPQIELLKFKSFNGVHEMDDQKVKSRDFLKHVLNAYKAILPLNEFLNRAIETEGENE